MGFITCHITPLVISLWYRDTDTDIHRDKHTETCVHRDKHANDTDTHTHTRKRTSTHTHTHTDTHTHKPHTYTSTHKHTHTLRTKSICGNQLARCSQCVSGLKMFIKRSKITIINTWV